LTCKKEGEGGTLKPRHPRFTLRENDDELKKKPTVVACPSKSAEAY